MRTLGLTFETVKPREPPCPLYSADPAQLAERLAVFKALQFKGKGIVVAADTLVAKEGKIYPKPSTPEEATRILRELRGGTHEVITGVAVVYSDCLLVSRERTIVVMRNFSDQELLRYVESGAPMDKAGAYGIQDEFRPVHSFEGCYQNVVGLPLCLVCRLLTKLNVKIHITMPEECRTCARASELRRCGLGTCHAGFIESVT